MLFNVISVLMLILILMFSFLHYFIRGGRRGELINKIPGPYAWPFIGNMMTFLVPAEELRPLVHDMNMKYYPIHRIWSLIWPVINMQHPDDFERVLSSTKHINKGVLYKFLHPWMRSGLLTSTGSKWQKRRKILTPAFHFNLLERFTDVFVEQGELLVETLKSEGKESVKELVPLLTKFTLNSICETAMGTQLNQMQSKAERDYRSAIHDFGNIVIYRLTRPWLIYDWMFNLTLAGRRQKQIVKTLHGFSAHIIEERKNYHEQTGYQYLENFLEQSKSSFILPEEGKTSGKKRLAMLDLLIAAWKDGRLIDDEGIREEVDTFMFEGHDTTAMGLCFALLALAEHQEIQNRARAEVDSLLLENNGKLTMAAVQNLHYLDRCIKESLRLFPPVPFISRHIKEELQLKNYVLPADTMLHLHIFDTHRDPNFWSDPDVYDPDRFLPDRVQSRHPFAYIPFSSGSRNCIGQRFAMLELKTLTASILHSFRLEPMQRISDIRFSPDLVLRPLNPVYVKFVPIDT